MQTNVISLSTARLTLEFEQLGNHLFLRKFRARRGDFSWLHGLSTSGLFTLYANHRRYDAHTLACREFRIDAETPGIQHGIARFNDDGFEVEHHVMVYADSALIEQWQTIRVTGAETVRITRLDSFLLDIPAGTDYELLSFNSDWGQEFEPVHVPLMGNVILETRTGRSSKGHHPIFTLFAGDKSVLSVSVAWSGNWNCRFDAPASTSLASGYRISGGLHDWEFAQDLPPGASMESPHVILALGDDLNDVAQQFARVGRRFWYPRNTLSAALPVEWNPWWSYEDKDINEQVFCDNLAAAAQLGIELCTLDAGWFGNGADWYQYRGDWDQVNTERFPHGIRALADETHAHGMKFGLWCEIEGLGAKSALAAAHPEFAALRDGASLGYVCFGNPDAQEWAYQTLSRLIRDYDCDWIKLDFNLDPEAGCTLTDHGHGAGDGLYEHYQGYYHVLDRIRQDFPEVVLENCASGGQRIDLGMLRHTHLTFLSDPDWPVHSLQVFWGATTMLAPDACLHWSFSEWRAGNGPPLQNFNPRDPALKPYQLDTYTRISMLGLLGFSQKLPLLPDWVQSRLSDHIEVYKTHVRRFVRAADLYRLTAQPRRDGQGERWCAFQYRLPDGSEHLVFVFRLPGAEPERAIRLHALQPDRLYMIEGFEGERFAPMMGHALMEQGITFATLPEEGSALLRLS